MSRDIIIHYDESGGRIVCSTVEHTLTLPLLAQALPLETLVETLRTKEPDEAERTMGAAILALLDISSETKIGIRDYSTSTEEWEKEHASELEKRCAAGDSVAQYELAMQLIAEGLRTRSKGVMDEADVLLRRAAIAKNAEAVEYLENLWPALKARSDQGFK